ncbi:MAG: hypothetical protein ISS70_23645 [Phycisphaerae bacterium]|nr:hypothetical protein [Phycisphaerae bacterium]
MIRRDFVLSSAGFITMLCTAGVWAVQNIFSKKKLYKFESVNTGKTFAPVNRVTPDDGYH